MAAGDLAAAVALLPRLAGLIVPKAEDPARLRALDDELTGHAHAAGLPAGQPALLPIVESARGVLAAPAIAASGPRVATLLFGTLDDDAGLVRSSVAARELGFTGRVVLHPRQLDPVRTAFSPGDAERERAREVLAAHGRARADGVGALRLADGTFVDRPVVLRAAALLGAPVPEGL